MSVAAVESQAGENDPGASKAGTLNFQPVEFLTSDRWLITCWQGEAAVRPEGLFETVAERWPSSSFGTAGDLGLLILHELARSYTDARRELYSWLETWELDFVKRQEKTETRTLEELRALISAFRKQLTEAHRGGIHEHPETVWFSGVTNLEEAERVDDLIDRALNDLRALSEALIASISLVLTIRIAAESQRNETFQRWLAAGAAVLLVPTLVASVYGVSTPVPGGDEWWGFAIVFGLVLVSAAVTVFVLRRFNPGGPEEPHPSQEPPAELGASPSAESASSADGVETAPNPAIVLYDHLARNPRSKSPRLLHVFTENVLLTPEEIGSLLSAESAESPMSKDGARAVLRNIGRAQARLQAAGELERDVLQKDFSRYDEEGSGRYGLTEADKGALARHINSGRR